MARSVGQLRRTVVAVLLSIAAITCGYIPAETGSHSDQLWEPVRLDIPNAPTAAADYLSKKAREVIAGPAAVLEILRRAGVPVVSYRTGGIMDSPLGSSYVDARVYDLSIPTIAKSL